MYRLRTESKTKLVVKKSEFIAILLRVENEDEVKEHIKAIRKEHPKARHVCHAVIVHGEQLVERSNDDGEPAGTAGLPILEVLRKRELENVLAVVVRYFGGVLLGSGGLIRAYSQSIAQCIDNAELSEVKEMLQSTIRFPIRYTDSLLSLLKETTILSKEFSEDVTLTLVSETDNWKSDCNTICSGNFEIVEQKAVITEICR
ncbi:MAG: YigZ family protein [Erysipelotrichaceae bacterium]